MTVLNLKYCFVQLEQKAAFNIPGLNALALLWNMISFIELA